MQSHPLAVAVIAALQAACTPAPLAPVVVSPPTPTCSAAPPPPSAPAAAVPPSPLTSATVTPAVLSPPEPAPPPPALQEALDAAGKAIAVGDAATAEERIAAAAAVAGNDAHLTYLVGRVRAGALRL